MWVSNDDAEACADPKTGSRGFGLFAVNDIKEGSFVIDYRGEVISLK